MNSSGNDRPSNGPLVVVALATLLALVVFTAPLTTLEAMTATFGMSSGLQAWVMSGTPLGAAAGLLTAGALGDTLGRRRTFIGGIWLTAVASVVAALAPEAVFLIAARIAQGLGTAGVMACGLGLLGQVYSGEARRHAAGVWAASIGAGVAVGPILASLTMNFAGWQAIHWLLAAICAALAVRAVSMLPESPRADERVDIAGSVLLVTGLGALLAALIEVRFGLTVPVIGLIAAGGILIGLFLRVERRVANPILRLDLFRRADFTGATIAAFASGAGVLALMSMVPTLLERGYGVAPLIAAFVLLAWSAVTIFSALGARYLPDTLSARTLAVVSILGCAAGQLLLILADRGSGWWVVLPGLFVAGVSNGILNASLGHAAVETVPEERSAMGSAANNTARYLGSAIGIALISILIAGTHGKGLFVGWHESVIATSALGVLGALAMVRLSGAEADARAS
ncbi:MFS transporter [Rhodobium gokarnense]|uniref:MFS family permease n=1 Tax=Rhodobium gokarnense TaxID=364296 RepID=A0ABT3HET0_9HYPH|nr:MFS transporter [Rhodobium gokarnense]MCW2308908.1 MFS family permease [Rhodobium gokarnense]